MNARTIARSLWVAGILLNIGALVLFAANYPFRGLAGSLPPIAEVGLILLVIYVLSLGTFVSRRVPHNAVGWILLGIGLSMSVAAFTINYGVHGLVKRPGSLVAPEWVTAIGGTITIPAMWLPIILLLALFPTGRLPSRRWRPILWIAGLASALLFVLSFAPGPLQDFPGTSNPLAIEGLGVAAEALGTGAWLLIMLSVLLAALSLVVRTIRSKGEERQQLKWVGASALMVVLGVVTMLTVGPAWENPPPLVDAVIPFLIGVGLVSLPLTTTLAVLRYRLYDIDLVLNRALVYALLTVLLAAAYVAGVALLQFLLPVSSDNQLIVVLTTLAVAALFRPGLRSIQAFVDRRFYRAKYDAAKTIDAFRERLRDEVDLDILAANLVRAAATTMQPAHIALWLRDHGREVNR